MGVVSHLPMHRRALVPTRIFALSILALVGMGCGQTEGERCQVNSDCKSGLICVNASGSLFAANGGVCQSTNTPSTPDAAIKSDTSIAPDSASKSDAQSRDILPDLVSKADTITDVPQTNDAAVDAPQTADAPADAPQSPDASDGQVD